MAPIDPHSYTDSTHPFTTHISLALYFDFPSFTLHSTSRLSFPHPFTGLLSLDTRDLTIHSISDSASNSPLPYTLTAPNPSLGQQLTISLSNTSSILISFSTSPKSSALQWLIPPQTTLKKSPFVFTQCQAIHARAIFPCQDTPAARVTYSARLNIPANLSAVMSAKHVSRRPPVRGEAAGIAMWDDDFAGRVVEEFVMEQPIPPYLFAFAVGELGWREVGPRTRVYAEDDAGLLEIAAREFAGAEGMVREGEKLFGEYEWERFDLLVLPRSFPYGGMENPRMVFLTPTVIKGDGSGAQVVAHELAHSWTGNLITNKNNEHFWLNEVNGSLGVVILDDD